MATNAAEQAGATVVLAMLLLRCLSAEQELYRASEQLSAELRKVGRPDLADKLEGAHTQLRATFLELGQAVQGGLDAMVGPDAPEPED